MTRDMNLLSDSGYSELFDSTRAATPLLSCHFLYFVHDPILSKHIFVALD